MTFRSNCRSPVIAEFYGYGILYLLITVTDHLSFCHSHPNNLEQPSHSQQLTGNNCSISTAVHSSATILLLILFLFIYLIRSTIIPGVNQELVYVHRALQVSDVAYVHCLLTLSPSVAEEIPRQIPSVETLRRVHCVTTYNSHNLRQNL